MENRIDSVLELENGEKYVVLNQAIYQEKNYYLVARLSEDAKQIEGEVKICEELLDDGVLAIKLVKDEKLIELLAKYFTPEY